MKLLKRRAPIRSCDQVFTFPVLVEGANHSTKAREHGSKRRHGDECQTWIDLLALHHRLAHRRAATAYEEEK